MTKNDPASTESLEHSEDDQINFSPWHGEPRLRDMLADPVIRSLMIRDRVDADEVLGLARRFRLQADRNGLSMGSSAGVVAAA